MNKYDQDYYRSRGGKRMTERLAVRRYAFITITQLPTPAGRKTSLYEITNARSGAVLGGLAWHGGWRQYVFACGLADD